MKSALKLQFAAALALLGAGMVLAGCKSAPQLTNQQALALIQAKYDSMPPVPVEINVGDLGMQEGVTAKYWEGARRYPNGYWADFKITPDGQKLFTQVSGGDVIQWRPEQPNDPHYTIPIKTIGTNRLKARDISDIQPSGDGSQTATYTEEVVLTGMPEPLQNIAHNPGNHLSTTRTATFTLQNGQWTLQSIN